MTVCQIWCEQLTVFLLHNSSVGQIWGLGVEDGVFGGRPTLCLVGRSGGDEWLGLNRVHVHGK